MAIAYGGGLGNSSTSGQTVLLTTTQAIPKGALLCVMMSADNVSATTPTFTAADNSGAGNTWSVAWQLARNATAAAGVSGGLLYTIAQADMASGTVITVTLSHNPVMKVGLGAWFTGIDTAAPLVGTATGNGASTAASASKSVTSGNLVIGSVSRETNAAVTAYDSDTTSGSWSTGIDRVSVTGGTATTRVAVAYQYKVPNATGTQTYDQTIPSTDWVAGVAEFKAAVVHDASASLSVSASPASTGLREAGAAASLAVSAATGSTGLCEIGASASLSVSAAAAASGGFNVSGAASLSVSAAPSAAGSRGLSAAASLSVSAAPGSAGLRETSAAASLTVSVGRSAAGHKAAGAAASLSVSALPSAAGVRAADGSASLSVSVAPVGSIAAAPITATASLTVGFSTTPQYKWHGWRVFHGTTERQASVTVFDGDSEVPVTAVESR